MQINQGKTREMWLGNKVQQKRFKLEHEFKKIEIFKYLGNSITRTKYI